MITLLYSSAFEPAVTLLQWQMVGNVFKLASWAMSFSIVAAARGKTFFFMELSFNIVFLSMVFVFSASRRFGSDSLRLRAGLPCLSYHRLCAGPQHSRISLAGTLSRPAGSAHEPWACAAGAGTDCPPCGGHGLTASCRGDGALRSPCRPEQSRQARPPPHTAVWNFCKAWLADPVSDIEK